MLGLGTLVSLIACTVTKKGPVNVAPNSLPTSGLVAYYPFSGNANDESGNGNNGTDSGLTLTTDRFGHQNSAYTFGGGYVKLSTCPLPADTNTPVDFTISAWVNTSTSTAQYGQSIFTQCTLDPIWGYDNVGIALLANNSVVYTVYPPSSGDLASTVQVQPNKWTHVVVIRNNKYRATYINNVLAGADSSAETYTASGGYSNQPDYNVVEAFIGKINSGNNGWNFTGQLDDIRIYNRVLTSTEIASLYHEGGWTGN
jgi:hypothetical protein